MNIRRESSRYRSTINPEEGESKYSIGSIDNEQINLTRLHDNLEQIDSLVQRTIGLLERFDNRTQELMYSSLQTVTSHNERQSLITKNIQITVQEISKLYKALDINNRVSPILQIDPDISAISNYINALRDVKDAIFVLSSYETLSFGSYISELGHLHTKSMANMEAKYRIDLGKVSQPIDATLLIIHSITQIPSIQYTDSESIALIPSDKADALYTTAQGIQDCALPGSKPGYLATFVDTRSIYIHETIKDYISYVVDYDVIEQSINYLKGTHPIIATVALIVGLFSAEFINCRSVMPGIHVSTAMNALIHVNLTRINENAEIMIEKAKKTIGTKYSGPVIYMLLDLSIQLKELCNTFDGESKGSEAEKFFADAMSRLPQMTNRASNQMLIAYVDDLEKSAKIQEEQIHIPVLPQFFGSTISTMIPTDYELLSFTTTATIHEVTLSALSFLKGLTEYEALIGQYKFRLDTRKRQAIPDFILNSITSEVEFSLTKTSVTAETESISTTITDRYNKEQRDSSSSSQNQKFYSSFYIFGMNILTALEIFLHQSANTLKKPAIGSIFLMNNNHYIARFLKSTRTLDLYFSDDISRYDKQVTNQMQIYMALSWISCIEKLKNDNLDASISRVRDILKQVSLALDEAMYIGKTCAIPNRELRLRVIKEIEERIIPPYELFINRHSKIIQNNPKWLKWEPSRLSSSIKNLFTLS